MSSPALQLFAACPRGVVDLLAEELRVLGAEVGRSHLAGVSFMGDLRIAYAACLWSRVASRIVLTLAEIDAYDDAGFYAAVRGQPWDDYSGRPLGPQDGKGYFVSLDAAYQATETLQFNAWAARDSAEITQDTRQATTLTNWSADIRNASQNYGLGARWKPMPRLETGGDVTYAFDSGKHALGVISGLGQVSSLPEYDYRHTQLKLFARYAARPDAGLRVEYIYDRRRTDDWTWTNWAYADGTVVSQEPVQKVNFFGVSYYHRFQ